MIRKLLIPFFVLMVVGVECGIAYLFMPRPSEATASPNSAIVEKIADSAKSELGKDAEENAQAEVDLGQFTVTAFQPATNSTLRIEFHLYGTVPSGSQKEFMKLLEDNQHRFRDQVIVTVRSSELMDLTDAGLGLIKRKILDKTNRTIGKPLLRSVIFSDYSFLEQ